MRQLRKEVSGADEGDMPEARRDAAESSRDLPRSHPGVDGADKTGRPLIPESWGAVVGALITAAASLLIYSLAQVNHIDERLDRLEQEARELLDGAGNIKPSREALQSYYAIEHLKERVRSLEQN